MTAALTSATATSSLVPPTASASATVSWSRSRESSLSIEHHGRCRRSRTPGAVRADRGHEVSYLGEHRGREVGLEATLGHRLPRHAQQQGTLLFSRDTHGRGLQLGRSRRSPGV